MYEYGVSMTYDGLSRFQFDVKTFINYVFTTEITLSVKLTLSRLNLSVIVMKYLS